MDVREKLVELLNEVQETGVNEIPAGFGCTREYVKNEMVASHLIAPGVTVQEWYSASEPPKDTYEYWIAYKAGGDYFYSTGYFDGKCWRSAITHKQIPVTHWAFLPQPPKGE